MPPPAADLTPALPACTEESCCGVTLTGSATLTALLRMFVAAAGDGCADLPARELQALNKELAELTPVVEALGAVQSAQSEVSSSSTAQHYAHDAAPSSSARQSSVRLLSPTETPWTSLP